MSNIHPTAIISAEARLADDVTVGPYAIIEGPVTLGPGCHIRAHAHLMGPLTMGARNSVHSGAVLGDWPQDRKYKGDFSETIIGDDNMFREGSTVHRGTGVNTKTIIGNRCFFMANSHAGHNTRVGDDVMMVNGAVLGGHATVGNRATVGAYCFVHQFCRVGRLAFISNASGGTVDIPPFFIVMVTNAVVQLNAVGLRRSGMPASSINGLRKMFQIAFRENRHRPLVRALEALPAEVLVVPEVQEVLEFCRTSKRGVARFRPWSQAKDALGDSDEE